MSCKNDPYATLLSPYKILIEREIEKTILTMGDKSILRDACSYALLNGGKRFRPAISLMVAEALGNKTDVTHAALSVEFFHTASLVVDDLPCMDNDDIRRNRPSLHKVYGDGITLLVSYALIAAGYACLARGAPSFDNSDQSKLCVLVLENATFNTGLCGATGGQFLDVAPPNLSVPMLKEIMHKKTVSLFEISFVIGWLYGKGDVKQLDIVKKAASHFGMAFQIADDISDVEQDKINGRSVNMAIVVGEAEAKRMVAEEIKGYLECLQLLGIQNSNLQNLVKTQLFSEL